MRFIRDINDLRGVASIFCYPCDKISVKEEMNLILN